MAWAQVEPNLVCEGTEPAWSLHIDAETARFLFQRDSDMTIPQRSVAEGRTWPQALTLVSRNDTAIVIIDSQSCDGAPYSADVLTQRGQPPILLTGCCKEAPCTAR